jgi:hypothetical protein
VIISKLDAARVQIDCAIEHFFNNDYICSVTLAGAAEDILGGLLKASGEQSPFEFLHAWYQETYNTKVSAREFSHQIANTARNWLKHSEDDARSKYDVLEQDSILMLMRAVPCYFKLKQPYTKQMNRFFQYINANIGEINELFA